MTLILTELSQAGIAMAADSAISWWIGNKLFTRDQTNWKKILRVPDIKAGVSYWGSVGLIKKSQRFDEWLEWRIRKWVERKIPDDYTRLRSFADYLAEEMNLALANKPLANIPETGIGIHVAGFQRWSDGALRPTLYHIHNGHSHVEFKQTFAELNEHKVLLETVPVWKMDEPRKLFARHDDFSEETKKLDSLAGNVTHLTRNGDYASFHIIFHHVMPLIAHLNTMPGFSIPGQIDKLGPRLRFLRTLIEITANIFKCSSGSKWIGGEVRTLGIRTDGYLND